jgi:hypothetical protein
MKRILMLCLISSILLGNTIEKKIAPYKKYLEEGTLGGQDWSSHLVTPKARDYTFQLAFEHFAQHHGKVIVELGTSRSFTHGGLPGCNRDETYFWTPQAPENWDWGAGFFTRIASECLEYLNPIIHTIDIHVSHINRCRLMTEPFKHFITYHVCSSLDFLRSCESDSIDFLYLDTGDMTPIEPTAQLQLAEAKLIVERNVLSKNGIILIDDVRNQTPKKFGETSDLGKSKYSLPYFLSHGYEIIANEYQVLLKKSLR